MSMNRRRHLVVLTLLAAGALTVLTQLPAHADVRTVYVGSFYFSTASGGPDNIALIVENGDQLRFVAQDNGHTVEIPDLGISQALSKGQTFTTKALTKAGTFSVYCAPHRNKGHATTLTVRAAAAESPPSPASEPAPPPAEEPAPAPAKSTSSGSSTTGSSGTTSGSTSGGSGAAPAASASTPMGGASAEAPAVDATPEPAAAGGVSPAPSAAEQEAATGLGTAAQDEVAVPAAPGSLEDLIGRPPAADGSWTRSVWMSLGLLLPMLALAGLALARRERPAALPDAP